MTSVSKNRLPDGGLIDRSKPLRFTFDGRGFTGFMGDTLASALVANGVRLVGRSFKYHRPRGIMTAGSEEPNALVTLRNGPYTEPNTRATNVQLFDGLSAVSQNRWPSLNMDLLSINQLAAPIFVAGFYYKTFMWPAKFWEKLYEPLIRRAAGLGRLAAVADPDSYDAAHGFCDLLVIGSGPAGLGAALVAGRAGARVILAEEDWLLGGRLLAERHEIDNSDASIWLRETLAELASLANVTILTRTAVFGAYDGDFGAVERLNDHVAAAAPRQPRQRLWKIVAKRTVLATGAIERTITFGGNDRPGVMTASAVSTYINRFAAIPGRRMAVFTSSASGWRTVDDLISAGVSLAAVVDTNPITPPEAARRAQQAGAEVFAGAVVKDVGGSSVKFINIRQASGREIRVPVDSLAMAGGWNPAMGIACNTGARPIWSDQVKGFVLDRPATGMAVTGAAAGKFALQEALNDGFRIGEGFARDLGFSVSETRIPAASQEETAVTAMWHVSGVKTKAFVDFQNDVTSDDIAIAAREGFTSVEHLKRYTTLGMATDQGKSSQVNGYGLLGVHTGRTIAQVGTVLSRPPFLPISIGVLAGHHREEYFRPTRLTTCHAWAMEMGAVFVDAGAWKRPRWFARPGEIDWLTTVSREVSATRSGVGVCDVSTLGKIDVRGPDAATLLDRLYVNNFSSLPTGKVRYGLMLREDGIVMDDGTVTRFADDHFFVTTTTVNAMKVMQHIDYCRQVLWPELDVQAVSVTEQWAQYAVAGPKSRALLQMLVPDLDFANEKFSYMAAKKAQWGETPVRLYRVSFSGELAYEIGVAATHGDALVRALMNVGKTFDVVPYGTEALTVMRIEKGHVAGNELNGQTTACDLGLGKMMSTKKDYIGRVLAGRPGLSAPDRFTLVGIRPVDMRARLDGGAHLLPIGAPADASLDQGYVSSVAYSPSLGHWIGLALLKRGPERIGERVRSYDPVRNKDIEVEVTSPVFSGIQKECAYVDRTPSPYPATSSNTIIDERARGVRVEEKVGLGLATIMRRGGVDTLELRSVLGIALPISPGWACEGGLGLVATGPDVWLATMESPPFDWVQQLETDLVDTASVSDQSGAFVVLRISGFGARMLMSRGAYIDFHPTSFGPGSAVSTYIAHIGVTLWQLDDAPTYQLAIPRSYAASFWHWLETSINALPTPMAI